MVWGLWNTFYVFGNKVGAILDRYSLNKTTLSWRWYLPPGEFTQNSRKLPEACLARLAVTQWGIIHVHIHSIWGLWNTFYIFDNEVGVILDGYPQQPHYAIVCPSFGSFTQNSRSRQLPKACWARLAVTQWEWELMMDNFPSRYHVPRVKPR